MIKVIICDDQAIIRDGLEMLLKLERDIEVVGLAQDGAQAVEMAGSAAPDLMLMDLKMPGMNGAEATRRIRARYPAIKVLVLTTYDDDNGSSTRSARGRPATCSRICRAKKWLKPFVAQLQVNRSSTLEWQGSYSSRLPAGAHSLLPL